MRNKRNHRTDIAAVLVSLLVHVFGISALPDPGQWTKTVKPEDYIELSRIDQKNEMVPHEAPIKAEKMENEKPLDILILPAVLAAQHQKELFDIDIRKPRETPPLPAEQAEPERKRENEDQGGDQYLQIVDLGSPKDSDETPENYRFLSERNMKVEKETVKPSEARTGSPGQQEKIEGKNEHPTNKDENSEPPKSVAKAGPPQERPGQAARPKSPDKPAPSGSQTETAPSDYGLMEPPGAEKPKPKSSPKRAQVSRSGAKKTEVEVAKPGSTAADGPDLAMNFYEASKSYESDTGSVDAMPKDVIKGDVTALNSKAYAYAPFFNQMKRVIKFYWEPQAALESVHWSGSSLTTELRIVTDAQGNIISVDITRSCGYPRVDAEAVKAVRRAAPFYNIPPDLLDESGRFVCPFGFVIEGR